MVARISAAAPAVEFPTAMLTGKRLLIIDDNEMNRQNLAVQAQSWGIVVYTAASGQEALNYLRLESAFDLAVLDSQMAEMDGLTLAKLIRHQPSGQTLPLVLLTTMNRAEVSSRSPEVRFTHYLSKPIKQSQFYNALVSLFDQQRHQPRSFSDPLAENISVQQSLRVLVAEDNVVNQKVILHLLQRLGYRAEIVNNGLEVLAALARQPYDVILMDVQMPEMDGLTATQQICQTWQPGDRPRIIAVTANATQGDWKECLEAGMDDYISKPIRIENLMQALSRCQPRSGGRESEGREEFEQSRSLPPLPPAVDVHKLKSLCQTISDNDTEILQELITCYLKEAPKMLQSIQAAVVQEDAIALRLAAHTLKSSSATLGATVFSSLCETIEQHETIAVCAPQLPLLVTEYERVATALHLIASDSG